MTDDELIELVKRRYTLADDLTSTWREEAVDLYDMIAGHQWEEVDKMRMDDQLRPAVTFNLAAKYLDAVSGLQIGNRQEIKYVPRQVMEDGPQNELLTGAAKWARDLCDAETEESEAFLDAVVTGLGAVEHFISTEEDPAGRFMSERRDPCEMFWDTNARKRNLVDARWIERIRLYEEDEFEEEWPGAREQMSNTSMGLRITETIGSRSDVHIATEAWKYENHAFGRDQRSLIPVFELQWYEKKKYTKVTTRMGEREMTTAQFQQFKQMLEAEGIPYSTQTYKKREYYRAFVAGEYVLKRGLSPCQTGFTYKFITGKRDRNKNTWHGIGRALKDPQQWVNKFFSDILFILQSNAKGGLMAEEDAFADPARAEAEWAKPDSITWMETGAISGKKVQEKPQAQYPQGLDRLMQFAMNAMPETTGLNMEVMGMANRVQPGIVEQQRKQAAMTVLSWAFDSMRRYYHETGSIMAEYIRKYLADGRLIRIAGEQSRQYIPLIREQINYDFDTIVDEAPHSTNQKERVFSYILEMLPYMKSAGMPLPPEFFEYSPLPSDMVRKLMERMQPDPQQQQIQETLAKLEVADKQKDVEKTDAEIGKDKSATVLNEVRARREAQEGQVSARSAILDEGVKLSEIDRNQAAGQKDRAVAQRPNNSDSG